MTTIINEYIENGVRVIQYSKDGITISHTVKALVPVEIVPTPQPTLEDKVNYIYYKSMGVIA